MPLEKSAGAVIFTRQHFPEKLSEQKQHTKNGAGFKKENGKIFYLLLHCPTGSRTKKDFWDFSKGHIKKTEEDLETAKREVFEETGLEDIKFVEGFKEEIKYFFKAQGKTIFKTVVFYLAETKEKNVKISFEHIGFKWLPYEGALEQLTFNNAKEILKKADDFLSGKSI